MKFERFSDTPVDNENEEGNRESNQIYRSTVHGLSATSSNHGCNYNHTEQEPETLENLLTWFSPKRVVIAISVLFLVLAGLVLLLAFIVRCDESKLISYYEDRKSSMDIAFAQFSAMWQGEMQERENHYKSKKIEWQRVSEFSDKIFEPAGNERYGSGNLLLYVARASYKNGTVVGKYCPGQRRMYYGYAGKEFIQSEFEILSYPHGSVSWLPRGKGEGLPSEDTLVFGGAAPETEDSTYICRLKMDGHLVLGKILKSSLGCIAAYMGKEFTADTFEILAINDMGRMLGIDS